jgi:hypothetical protein
MDDVRSSNATQPTLQTSAAAVNGRTPKIASGQRYWTDWIASSSRSRPRRNLQKGADHRL